LLTCFIETTFNNTPFNAEFNVILHLMLRCSNSFQNGTQINVKTTTSTTLMIIYLRCVHRGLSTALRHSSMINDTDKEDDSSTNQDDGESERADAVENGSCQRPVILYLILPVSFISLLVFFLNSSLQKVENFLHCFVCRLVLLC